MRIWLGLLTAGLLSVVVGLFRHVRLLARDQHRRARPDAVRADGVGRRLGRSSSWTPGGWASRCRCSSRTGAPSSASTACSASRVAGTLLFASHLVGVQRGFICRCSAVTRSARRHHGRYNVLLLGGDSGAGRWGLRPDSMTVASIDEETGRTVLFGLPRNMTNFPFPKGSVMAKQFPRRLRLRGLLPQRREHLGRGPQGAVRALRAPGCRRHRSWASRGSPA